MKTSEKAEEVLKAYVAFQGQIDNPEKDKTVKVKTKKGSTYSYNYATLSSMLAQIQKAAVDHDLSFSQEISTEAGQVSVKTYIFHSSGQWLEFGPLKLDIIKSGRMNANQAAGSTITYARRYALAAAAGIASEEDTDTSQIPSDAKKQSRGKKSRKTNQNKLDMEEAKTAIEATLDSMNENEVVTNCGPKEAQKFAQFWSENIKGDKKHRYSFLSEITGREIESTKDLYSGELKALRKLVTNRKQEFIQLANIFVSKGTG